MAQGYVKAVDLPQVIPVFPLPGAILLSRTSLGLTGIWIAYAASFTMMLVLQASWYRFVWLKKKIVALV